MKLILASASERRKEILSKLCVPFDIRVSNFDEKSIKFNGDVEAYVKALSKGKAEEIYNTLSKEEVSDFVVIGADTVVSVDEMILGKPKDSREAQDMLKRLSGREHEVYSGVTVINSNSFELSETVKTKVTFSKLSNADIEWYISTGEPFDKAGSYGIQGYAGTFVEKINGCYYNVVGLPLSTLVHMLKKMGVNLFTGV